MILIIEDNQEKASRIRQAVAAGGIDEANVVTIPDLVIAKDRLREGIQVLFLDLQIPDRFGDPANKNGGLKLLRWMERHLNNRPEHIVAVTGFAVSSETNQFLNKLRITVLHYEASTDTWSLFITGLVSRLAQSTITTPPPVKAVILTAVDIEMQQAKRVFGISGNGERKLGVSWHRARVNGQSVIVAKAPQMGIAPAAVLSTKAIRLWRPDVIIMVGICAGVKGEVDMGDIIVPNPCWDYGSGKLTDNILRPDPRPIQLSESIRVIIEASRDMDPLNYWHKSWPAEKPRSPPRIHLQPAASGSAVIADSVTVTEIQKQSRKVAGLDMENYGVYHACANSGQTPPPAFCAIKSVVDFADPNKSDKYQAYGASMSAQLGKWVVEQFDSGT